MVGTCPETSMGSTVSRVGVIAVKSGKGSTGSVSRSDVGIDVAFEKSVASHNCGLTGKGPGAGCNARLLVIREQGGGLLSRMKA